MKKLSIAIIITLAMLMTWGCKPQTSEIHQPNQNANDVAAAPAESDAAEIANTDGNQATPNSDVQKSSDADENVALQNAQQPTEGIDSELTQILSQAQELPDEYVDIAEWCRSKMTKPISAQEWAKANNAFGIKFLRQTKGNTVFSPYSIERALGMTLDGACDTTADEMLRALELPNAARLSLSGRDVDDAMKSVNADTMLEIENTLWPDKSMTLPEDYLARIGAGYRGKLISLDYAANPEKSRITINGAIAHTTHDRIKDLILPGMITEQTKLVLTNAVYFKSVWKQPFNKRDTYDIEFYNSDHKILTKMMFKNDGGNVCVGKDFAFYDLAFSSSKVVGDLKGAYVMRIILPEVDASMNDRMKQLEVVENLLSNGYENKCTIRDYDMVEISMPRFKLAPDTIHIKEMLKAMGMNRAFGDDAEFYAMPNSTQKPSDPSSYLMISDVLHKAFIEIDENGGEAAAATAVVMKPSGAYHPKRIQPTVYHFTVNHPFLFMIIEQSTGAAIFIGRVTDLQVIETDLSMSCGDLRFAR